MSSVNKSFQTHTDPIMDYCNRHTIKLHPLQVELQEETLRNAQDAVMLGAPEEMDRQGVSNCYPTDLSVTTLDISHDRYKKHGLPIISKCPVTLGKINAVEGPALRHLDKLIEEGQSGTFDFAFIDADSEHGATYYDRCVKLLKSGGVILVDNALWSGRVVDYSEEDSRTKLIDERNKAIAEDCRTNSFLINCGDGLHVAFKK